MTLRKNIQWMAGTLALAGLAACGGGDGGSTAQNGSLRFALTDAPACGYDAIHLTIQKIRVHQSANGGDKDGGWSEIVLNPARRVDLLELTNGRVYELGQTPLPAGKYNQIRVVLADNDTAHPLANSITPTGSAEVALKTPSGQQSGLKIKLDAALDILANKTGDFVLDFDACKSIVVAGNSGQYLLKPVVTVIPRYISGVDGFVDASLVTGYTSISLQQNGTVIKATVPDSQGKFLLQPVAPGSYTLVLSAPGRTTSVVTNVAVTTDTVTPLNTALNPLNPPASSSGTASGMAPAGTFVQALQPLTAGPTVQIAGNFVNGSTGQYSHPLVVNAPLVAPYAAAPASLVFVADTAAAGKYTLKASLDDLADKTAVLPLLTSGATVTTNFTFP